MTVGLYISPNDVPALMADSLVTWDGLNLSVVGTPASVRHATEIGPLTYARLVRKLYVIDRSTCVCLAGMEESIVDYLLTASGLIDILGQSGRPMQQLADLANDFTDLSVLGVHVRDDNTMNTLSRVNNRVSFQHLGQCAFIGSGARSVIKQCREWEQQLSTRRSEFPEDPVDLIRSVCSAHNSQVISQEGGFRRVQDWGGFMEYAYFDATDRRWHYGLPSMYATLILSRINDRTYQVNVGDTFILYRPSELLPRVLSATFRSDGVSLIQWGLENILGHRLIADDLDRLDVWRGFRPLVATLCVVVEAEEVKLLHVSTNLEEHVDLVCDIQPPRVALGFSSELLNKVAKGVARALRIRVNMLDDGGIASF